MGYCRGDCEYLTSRHNCKKYHKSLAYSSFSSKSLAYSSHERCSECEKDYRIKELETALKEKWIPVEERLPEDDRYILLSFSNFSLPAVGRYESDERGGAFYLGDCDEEDTCVANDLFVNAWMPLPEPYRPN